MPSRREAVRPHHRPDITLRVVPHTTGAHGLMRAGFRHPETAPPTPVAQGALGI